MPIVQVAPGTSTRRTSGVPELDRVLGGGLVDGAVVLVAGEPGVGKSTLLLEVAARSARRVLYVSGEESPGQVRLRADRTGAIRPELYLAAETDLAAVLTQIDLVRPDLLVVDSVQTLAAAEVEGVPGGVSQVKAVAATLTRLAKTRGLTTVLIGHVTKDGAIAGPRVLEHVVDVVLSFEGQRESRFRMLRALKNRFGPVDEVGCFDLSASGISGVTDPSGLFVETRHGAVAGSCVAMLVDGRRALPVEIQALVTPSHGERPRRAVTGLDSTRVAMLQAVLHQHCELSLATRDVVVAPVGGVRVQEPGADLGLAVALASAFRGVPPLPGLTVIGEVGLSGSVRRVPELSGRLATAARLGFRSALVPAAGLTEEQLPDPAEIEVIAVGDVRAALVRAGVLDPLRRVGVA